MVILIFSAESAIPAPGKTALDFLNLPVGARSASMGQGCFAGIIGPEAIFGNPSLLGTTALFASHQELLLDTRSQALAIAVDLGRNLTLGLGALFFSPGNITGYTQDNIRTGSIDAGDRVVKLALSRSGGISVGIAASIYNQRLDNRTGTGFGAGAGIAVETELGRFALTADNIGPEYKIGSLAAPLPGRISFSGWIPIFDAPVMLSYDLTYRYEMGLGGSAGIEYRPLNGFGVRAGSNNSNPLAFGLFLSQGRMGFDYSYIPPGKFGDKHILSFNLTK